FQNLLKKCLDAKKEKIIIIADYGYAGKRIAPLMAASYYVAAKELGLNSHLVLQEPRIKGETADKKITDAMLDLRKENIIITCMSYRIGSLGAELGKSYRTFAIEQKHRWLSATKLGDLDTEKYAHFIDAVNIDYEKMSEKAGKIKSELDNGSELHVTTPAGTDLRMSIRGKTAKCNDGNARETGTGGNMPAGEVYIPPKWKTVNGTAVIDGSSSYRFGTQLIKEPIKITIEKDEAIKIKGGKEADNLKKTLDWAEKKAKHPWGIKRVGEFGIGINPKARIIGATIMDEKALDTAHIALGSNYWFGGTIYAITHLDQIFRNPKVFVDGKKLKI
ncbi:aminopeptidase, partial [Candidatus Woesearchaeota archaeon]|nr:aminopeptidase [Candidatus Woesearchaeota archaeon]